MADIVFNGNIEKFKDKIVINITFTDSKDNIIFKYTINHNNKEDIKKSVYGLDRHITYAEQNINVYLQFDNIKKDINSGTSTYIFGKYDKYVFYTKSFSET